jgi:hypothetical protein
MQDRGCGLPRNPFSRRQVNESKEKGLEQGSPGPHSALLPRLWTLRLSEVAELARFKPVQHQLEGAGLDTRAARERMVQHADGKKYQGDNPR